MTYIPQPTPRPVVVAVRGSATGSHDPSHYPIDVSFMYDVARPFSVVIDLAAIDGHDYEEDGRYARWEVSREVLHAGCVWRSLAGLGDFFVIPVNDDAVTMRFHASNNCGPDCTRAHWLDVTVPRPQVLRFLEMSLNVVPIGRESGYLDLDGGLSDLLAGRHTW